MARFQALFEHAPLPYQSLDAEGRFLKVNRAWEEQFGYRRDEVAGHSFADMMDPESTSSFDERFARFRETGRIVGGEWELIRRDGSKRLYALDGRFVFDESGAPAESHCILRDVTEQRRVQARLDRELTVSRSLASLAQSMLRPGATVEKLAADFLEHALAMTGAANGFVATVDAGQGITVNHTASLMSAACPFPVTDAPITFPSAPDGSFPGLWGVCLNTGRSFLTNEPANHVAARGIPERHVPIRNFLGVPALHQGEPLGMIALANAANGFTGAHQDAVERLVATFTLAIVQAKAQRTARTAAGLYQELLNAIDEVVFEMSVEGVLRYASPGIRNWFGQSAEELEGKYLYKALPQVPMQPFQRALLVLRTQQQVIIEVPIPRPRGDGVRWISCTLAPVRRDNQLVGMRGLASDITARKEAEEVRRNSFAKLQAALTGTIQAFTHTVEMRDPYTAGHQRRVAHLARAIAQEMGLSEDQVEGIRVAASIHDLGKMSIPTEILSKPGRLLPLQFSLVQAHCDTGYEILDSLTFPWPVATAVHQHHERLDGSGYPKGLKGNAIILDARIIAVADVVEAMASHRPYRPALGVEVALQEIESKAGLLFDRDVVEATARLFRKKNYQLQ